MSKYTPAAPIEVPGFYTKEEVQAKIGVSYRTLLRWQVSCGFPRSLKIGAGTFVFLAEEVDGWLVKQLTRSARHR
jgi:predicted DNA-binding transcriptional regulator AlpA